MKTVEKQLFTANDMKIANKRILDKLEKLNLKPLETPPKIQSFSDFGKLKTLYLK